MSRETFVDRRTMDFAHASGRLPTLVEVEREPSQLIEPDGSPTWVIRGANFVVAITRAQESTRLVREQQADEYMLFIPPNGAAEVLHKGERIVIEPDSLTIIPPGPSDVIVTAGADVVRIFSSRAADLAGVASNALAYADDHREVAPLVDWPQPRGGQRVRSYPMKGVVAGDAFGRIYRSTNLMVNIFEPYSAPRDQTALSPHSHDDFEQGSLTLSGTFQHYLRTPWGKDRTTWRSDETLECGSPSMLVVPVGTIHTTAWFGFGGRMIDIFSPPRADFSRKPGWVRNDADYPAPRWVFEQDHGK